MGSYKGSPQPKVVAQRASKEARKPIVMDGAEKESIAIKRVKAQAIRL